MCLCIALHTVERKVGRLCGASSTSLLGTLSGQCSCAFHANEFIAKPIAVDRICAIHESAANTLVSSASLDSVLVESPIL